MPHDEPLDLTEPQPFLRPFPDPAAVFAGDVARARRLLHPLVSIELSAVDPAWSGWIHLLSPIEPVEDYLGAGTERFHSPYARTNWIGFRLDADDRYEFLGDWRYFLAESDDVDVRSAPELVAAYAEQERWFTAYDRLFREHGRLIPADVWARTGSGSEVPQPLPFLEGWDEPGYAGNWADAEMFPLEIVEDGDDDLAYPLTEDGRRFRFIASVPGWNYRESGADSILLFFDPETRIALLTFDWT